MGAMTARVSVGAQPPAKAAHYAFQAPDRIRRLVLPQLNRILDAPADPTLLFELCADLSQAPESQAFCFVRSVPAAGARRAFASDANDTGFHALTAR